MSARDGIGSPPKWLRINNGFPEHYYCFCNVETAIVIDEYLKECTDIGEVLQNDTPLIKDLNNLNTKKVKPLTIYKIKYIVHEIVEKSGVRDSFQVTGELHVSHSFRKFFVTQCESSSMKSVHVYILKGS
jgi:hypothetical protein